MNWIDLVTVFDGSKGHDVVNMNEAIGDVAKLLPEGYAADVAPMAVMGNARSTCQGGGGGVDNDSPFGTLGESGGDWSR